MAKTMRLELRVTPNIKNLIKIACAINGVTLTDYIIASATNDANKKTSEYQSVIETERHKKVVINTLKSYSDNLLYPQLSFFFCSIFVLAMKIVGHLSSLCQ